MKKRILSLLLTICMLLMAVPVSAGAATGQQVSADAVSVTAGNSVTLTLKAENFESIAALDVVLYYDPAALTLSSTANGSKLNGAQASVNTNTPGEVKLSLMSLTPISGTGTLLTIRFTTKADCVPGKYPVAVTIGRAYDSNLSPAEVKGINGSVTVNAAVPAEKFTLYCYPDKTSVKTGDVIAVRLANGSGKPFVSGEFLYTYDPEIFAYEALTWESTMTKEGAVYSVNSTVAGQVRVAYANDEPVSDFYMMTLKLKVIGNVDGKSTLNFEATNLYREDLSLYLPGSTYKDITLTKIAEEADHPDVYFETENLVTGETGASVLYLEAGANLAAADFTLSYDPNVLSCAGVENLSEALGGMLVVSDKYKEGTVRFSYVNQTPPAETIPVLKILWEPQTAQHYTFDLLAEGTVDTDYNKVTLDCPETTGCIYLTERTEPTCEADGAITYTCSCGNSLPAVVLPTEHPWDAGVYTEPTYESDGFTTYTCTNCGKTKTVMAEGTRLQPAAIFLQPETVNTDAGNQAVFHVVASNTAVSYKWEYRKIYKWFNTTMDGYDTDTLTVTATGARNGYDYRCTITFADGTVLISEPAELTVNTVIDILKDPNDQTVVLGYKGQFTASAIGESISYQWQYCRPGSEKWIDTAMEGATKPTVMIETTTARDGYRYRCKITDIAGLVVYTEPATMRVLSVKGHPQAAYAPVGGTAYFTVTTSVPDGFTYQWQYSRNGGSSWSNTTMEGYNTATLTVAATKARNGYLYRCVLTGSKNSRIESKAAALCVSEPVVITAQPENVTAATGTTAVFKVTATNVFSYRWQYARKGSDTWQNTSLSGYATDTLSVEVLTSRNGYRYRCLIVGLDGQTYYTDPATLKIG